jgi:hypothetical protein
LFQNNPKWWTWDCGGYDVEAHEISFAITGMQVQKIGLITAPNLILPYTMMPIALHMLVYGISHGFSLNEFARFNMFSSIFTSIWEKHLQMIIARVYRLPGIPTEK